MSYAAVQTDDNGGAIESLDVVANRIKFHWKKDEDNRVTLGCLLVEAKRRVDAGEWFNPFSELVGEWGAFKLTVLGLDLRSDRDIRRLLAIGNSGDPLAKAADDRRKAREGMQRSRTNVSPATVQEAAAEVRVEAQHSAVDPTADSAVTPVLAADDPAIWDLAAPRGEITNRAFGKLKTKRQVEILRVLWGYLPDAEQAAFLDWATAPDSVGQVESDLADINWYAVAVEAMQKLGLSERTRFRDWLHQSGLV